jgi:hypothetical protein
MHLEYVPLLQTQRELHDLPRSHERFQQYLRAMQNPHGGDGMRVPMLVMNPMGKDHVAALLDQLLVLDADNLATQVLAEVAPQVADVPGSVKVALVVADDLKGAWTNRYAWEFDFRFRSVCDPSVETLPRWLKHVWLTAALWSSEPASERAVREAILTAVQRVAFVQRNGPARTLEQMLAQEGQVLAAAGCARPMLDAEDIAHTREVLVPFLGADDMRTCIECLFGDAAGRTLGFTPRGLSPWAGLALALHDARLRRNLRQLSILR